MLTNLLFTLLILIVLQECISWYSGVNNPIHPSFWQCTDTFPTKRKRGRCQFKYFPSLFWKVRRQDTHVSARALSLMANIARVTCLPLLRCVVALRKLSHDIAGYIAIVCYPMKVPSPSRSTTESTQWKEIPSGSIQWVVVGPISSSALKKLGNGSKQQVLWKIGYWELFIN